MIRLSIIDPVRFLCQLDTYEQRYLRVGHFVSGETPGTSYVVESIDDEGQAVMMITGQRDSKGKRL